MHWYNNWTGFIVWVRLVSTVQCVSKNSRDMLGNIILLPQRILTPCQNSYLCAQSWRMDSKFEGVKRSRIFHSTGEKDPRAILHTITDKRVPAYFWPTDCTAITSVSRSLVYSSLDAAVPQLFIISLPPHLLCFFVYQQYFYIGLST